MRPEQHLEIRAPFDTMEQEVVRRALARPDDVPQNVVDALRYVLSFARLTLVRAASGQDVDLSGLLAPHAWRVRTTLQPHLDPVAKDPQLWDALRVLPELVQETREARARVLEVTPLDRSSLEEEVTSRVLALAAGGGGGAGYGYSGVFTLLYRNNLEPQVVAGTSIGAIIGIFRARRRRFDVAAMFEAGRRMSWGSLFKVLNMESRFGLPAGLRLHLRNVLGPFFVHPDGKPLTMADLEIPMRIVTTGIRMDALRHDLAYYEHFLDDALGDGAPLSGSRLRHVGRVVEVVRELMADPSLLQEIVFGEDPLTAQSDVIDAVGFSSAIPGFIHYDIVRDDQRMCSLLDDLYSHHGIARLAEGGLVANVPARTAYRAVMSGVARRRNVFVLAMDCFSPRPSSLLFYPLQQVVRPNVVRNLAFANLYFPLRKTLSPLNLAPSARSLQQSMDWAGAELKPHIPFIKAMCASIPVLSDA